MSTLKLVKGRLAANIPLEREIPILSSRKKTADTVAQAAARLNLTNGARDGMYAVVCAFAVLSPALRRMDSVGGMTNEEKIGVQRVLMACWEAVENAPEIKSRFVIK